MSSSPKSSLVERLVQDRLRSGDLEASAAQLLHLGEDDPGKVTGADQAGGPGGDHDAGINGHVLTADVAPAADVLTPVSQSLVTELPIQSYSTESYLADPYRD